MHTRIVTASVIALMVLTGCGKDPRTAGPSPSTSGSTHATSEASGMGSSSSRDELTGTWTRRLDETEAVATLGVSRAKVDDIMGWEGVRAADIVYKFGADSWTQFQVTGGESEVGDAGTYRIDDNGRMVLTSVPDSGAAATDFVFRITIDGDELTTRMLDRVGSSAPLHLRVTRMITEGTYHRVDP